MEQRRETPRMLSIALSAILSVTFLLEGCGQNRAFMQDKQEIGQGVHVLFVDAGSTGSKATSFGQKKVVVKLLTQCTDAQEKNGFTNRGAASLAYTTDECSWQIGTGKDELKPLQDPRKYAKELLQLLFDTYKEESGSSDVTKVKNRDAVPILGTAGMRLLSMADNQKVWGYICGKSHAGLTLAQAGDMCGTIPGTTEAYYEYLANAVAGKSKSLTGTFTIGGGSAQIAIPLKTPDDVTAFKNTRGRIANKIDCTKLLLPSGEQVPHFNTIKEGGPKQECIDDYITFLPKDKITVSGDVEQNHIQTSQIQGVGLISFLGLQGSSTIVAGGVNEIQNWAKQEHCATNETSFSLCAAKLKAALDRDVLFSEVREYFQSNALDVQNFSYNTYAAFPEAMGIKHVEGKDEAWDLEKELTNKCSKNNGVRFGYKGQNTCMKALFTSLYVTSFFERPSSGAREKGLHSATSLSYEPSAADWSKGFIEEAANMETDRRRLEPELINSLLNIPFSRSYSFLDGARIHNSVKS